MGSGSGVVALPLKVDIPGVETDVWLVPSRGTTHACPCASVAFHNDKGTHYVGRL
jgi:hypothetical protein